ncbi:MAG: GspE/PulE family protein [Patescibacteria group bacterium]
MGDNTQQKTKQYQKIDLYKTEVPYKILKTISKEAAQKYQMVVFEKKDSLIKVAMVNPEDVEALNALRFIASQSGLEIEIYKISSEDFNEVFKGYDRPDVVIDKAVKDYEIKEKKLAKQVDETKKKKELTSREMGLAPVEKIVDVIINHAILGGASDIHIEPMEKSLRVRYRVDGDLFTSFTMAKNIAPAIVSRVKIMSNLRIDEKRKPQDGRLKIVYEGKNIDVRVSTLPTSEGEKVVMRLLEKQEGLDEFEKLGLGGRNLDIIEKEIQEPYGIILVTGPTGSGKSTTIFTALNKINKIDRNIVTLEDPVEYKVPGVNHSQVKPDIGFTFASGLRSILRQDPDIIMVGEIRDGETAELATHAALTGHLVLSTLHTNDAMGAIPRLVDMGIEPFLLSSSLRVSIAQRLIRKLCDSCKKQTQPSQRIKEYILKSLELIPEEEKKRRIPDFDSQNIKIWEAPGCPKCKNTGTKGRIAIFEVVECTKEMRSIIDDDLTATALNKEFRRQGATFMREDGVIKALNGDITIEAVEQATSVDETEPSEKTQEQSEESEIRPQKKETVQSQSPAAEEQTVKIK